MERVTHYPPEIKTSIPLTRSLKSHFSARIHQFWTFLLGEFPLIVRACFSPEAELTREGLPQVKGKVVCLSNDSTVLLTNGYQIIFPNEELDRIEVLKR